MASYVIYPGDGAQTDFAVPFPYLSTDHVKVYSGGVAVTPTWINSALIRVSPAVASGSVLLISRQTTKAPMTVFENTNNLTAENLTLAETQALFIAEEASDRAEQSIIVSEANGQYDFGNRRATNVSDPVDDQDAVTKKWAVTAQTSVLAQAIQQATNAAASATQADTDAGYAAAERLTISGWKDTINGWMNTISGWKDQINGWYTAVQGWYTSVNTWQAQVTTDKGTVAADKATVAADKATTSGFKDAASTSATNAHTSEVNAAASAAAAALSAGSVDGPNLLTKSGNLGGLVDASAARTNLGLGNVAVKNAALVSQIRNNTNGNVITVDGAYSASQWVDLGNISGAVAINCDNGFRFRGIMVGNCTFSFTNVKDGKPIELDLIQDATGSRTASWSGVVWANGVAPSVSTAANNHALYFSGIGLWDNASVSAVAWKFG